MPDQKFFSRPTGLSLAEISDLTGALPAPGVDMVRVMVDVAPLDIAGPQDIGFLDNVKYRGDFRTTKAGACFVRPEFATEAPKGLIVLATPDPYRAYALTAQKFYPEPPTAGVVSPASHVHPSVRLGKGCDVGPGAVIEAGVVIGDYCRIEANAVIGAGVSIGDHTRIGPGAVVTHAVIGNHVNIYPGACIGQDGFGFAPGPDGHVKVPQLGRVIIEDHVEIGANATIDRGSAPDTVIGQGTWIDNLVHVAHNVKIGRGCMIAAQCGFAGSAVIDDFVAMGGQVGIAGHLHVGKGVRLAGQSGVVGDVPPGAEYMGFPARPAKDFLKGVAFLNRLIKREKSS